MIEGHKSPCTEGLLLNHPDCQDSPPNHKRWVLAASILGSSLAFILGSVVNVALPAIQENLGANGPQMQWILSSYLLFLGALILTGGSAGDVFGRRIVFIIGILIFHCRFYLVWIRL